MSVEETCILQIKQTKKKAEDQNLKPQNILLTTYLANISWLFTPRLGDFIYFHLWKSLRAMNPSEQGGREEQGCPWQQSVSCFYIQGQRGTNDTTWIHYCDTGACTGKFCCPAEKWGEVVGGENKLDIAKFGLKTPILEKGTKFSSELTSMIELTFLDNISSAGSEMEVTTTDQLFK